MSTTTNIRVPASAIKRPVYQRFLNPKRVAAIAADFNPDAVGALTVSKRDDGGLYIVDGGHRQGAAIEANYDGKLLCIQYEGLTLDEEAELFLELNDAKAVQPVDKFKAAVIAGRPTQVGVNTIAENHGWTVKGGGGSGKISAVSALETLYQVPGSTVPTPYVLDTTLDVITEAWGHDPAGTTKYLVLGVGKVLRRYEGQVDPDALAPKLSKYTPRQVLAKGRALNDTQGGTVAAAVAKVVVGIYNTKRQARGRLPEWVGTR